MSIQNELLNENINKIHEISHKVLSEEGKVTSLDLDGLKESVSKYKIKKSISDISKKFEYKWNVASENQILLSSATGTHQALMEVYGAESDEIYVVFQVMEDERLCGFCNHVAFDHTGERKKYKISSLKPAGYNMSRKKAEWKPSIVPSHYNCRCSMVYVPLGFKVNKDGILEVI
jgi:hypothetical protein